MAFTWQFCSDVKYFSNLSSRLRVVQRKEQASCEISGVVKRIWKSQRFTDKERESL